MTMDDDGDGGRLLQVPSAPSPQHIHRPLAVVVVVVVVVDMTSDAPILARCLVGLGVTLVVRVQRKGYYCLIAYRRAYALHDAWTGGMREQRLLERAIFQSYPIPNRVKKSKPIPREKAAHRRRIIPGQTTSTERKLEKKKLLIGGGPQ